MRIIFFVFMLILFLSSCNSEPQPIEFGKDNCEFCKMTIIDKKFGAELINSKGKTLKFDAIECMMSYYKINADFNPEKYLVVDYEKNVGLIDGEQAFFLQGGNVRSPMGGNIAAFSTREAAERFHQELQGDILLWNKVAQFNF